MTTTTSKNLHRSPPKLGAAMLIVACATVLCGVAAAQAPAPAATDQCMDALLNMSSCLTYVQSGSTAKKPDEGCCPALAGLVDSNPVCLCDLLAGAAESFGITIDDARALKLPTICSVETPPPSTCIALGYNVSSIGSPSPSPSSVPEIPGSSPSALPGSAASNSRNIRSGDHIIVFTMALSCLVAVFIAMPPVFSLNCLS